MITKIKAPPPSRHVNTPGPLQKAITIKRLLDDT